MRLRLTTSLPNPAMRCGPAACRSSSPSAGPGRPPARSRGRLLSIRAPSAFRWRGGCRDHRDTGRPACATTGWAARAWQQPSRGRAVPPAADFERLWSEEALRWRLANPETSYDQEGRAGYLSIAAPAAPVAATPRARMATVIAVKAGARRRLRAARRRSWIMRPRRTRWATTRRSEPPIFGVGVGVGKENGGKVSVRAGSRLSATAKSRN